MRARPSLLVLVASIAIGAGTVIACSLNPQPLPPLTGGEDNNTPGADAAAPGTGGGSPDGGTAKTDGSAPVVDAGGAETAPPPMADAGSDADQLGDGGADEGG